MSTPPTHRGRGRGRGGLGKYLRAKGRRGTGRPAEFVTRLRLEDEDDDHSGSGDEDGEDGEGDERAEQRKYAKRNIGTNADRYEEPEVDPHAEEEPEPEVDLSEFLARQRLELESTVVSKPTVETDDDEVDHTLSHLPSTSNFSKSRKNNVHTIEWDASLDELKREKEAAEAVRDLKTRFRKNQPRVPVVVVKQSRDPEIDSKVVDSRHLPDTDKDTDANLKPSIKSDMTELEDFLDDLLD
ncbi:hypothetical protein BU17DRAFT_95830 [Hysterangium stoloniferum]|nr:hypothetical protein BU17DRAFT_95830 [Hysterangium stoloniferum]